MKLRTWSEPWSLWGATRVLTAESLPAHPNTRIATHTEEEGVEALSAQLPQPNARTKEEEEVEVLSATDPFPHNSLPLKFVFSMPGPEYILGKGGV